MGMSFSDYISEVTECAEEAIRSGEYDYCADVDEVLDEMWTDDAITGNGSGSYTFNAYRAEQNTAGLIWDDDFREALADLGMTLESVISDGAEALDVAARCLALGYIHDDVEAAWDERAEELEAEEDEDEEDEEEDEEESAE